MELKNKKYIGPTIILLIILIIYTVLYLIISIKIFTLFIQENYILSIVIPIIIISLGIIIPYYLSYLMYSRKLIKKVTFMNERMLIYTNKNNIAEISYGKIIKIYKYNNLYVYITTDDYKHSKFYNKGVILSNWFDSKITKEINKRIKIKTERINQNQYYDITLIKSNKLILPWN